MALVLLSSQLSNKSVVTVFQKPHLLHSNPVKDLHRILVFPIHRTLIPLDMKCGLGTSRERELIVSECLLYARHCAESFINNAYLNTVSLKDGISISVI